MAAKESILNRRAFLGMAVKLSLPIMVQNLISTLVSSADTVMLGYVSQTAMSASSLANQFTFLLYCFYYGLAAGTSVLCAQYFGKGDHRTIERVMALATRLTVSVSLLFFAAAFFFPKFIMSLFTDSPETIAIGISYLQVVAFSFAFMGFSQVLLSALRSMGKVIFPSVTYIISLLVNICLNAVFIFGLFGMPALGVIGVALGTVIARVVEAVLCLIYTACSKDVRLRLRDLFGRSGVLMGDFLKLSTPSMVNDVVWGLAASVFAAILGHIGDDMVAANAVAMMVVNIGAIACRGFANATTIVVSQALGAGNIPAAKVYSKRMLGLTLLVSLLGCCIMLAIRPYMIRFYGDKLSATALRYLGAIMIMTTWRLVGEAINTCLICGCFRGGGDSRFGMIVDTLVMWCVAVPLMAAAAYLIKLPPIWVYFVMTLDEYEKMPIVLAHYFRFRWLKNITRDTSELD